MGAREFIMQKGHRNQERNRRRPEVEALESIVPLSGMSGMMGGGGVLVAPEVRAVHRAQGVTLALQGTVRGGYFVPFGVPDTGKTYHIGVAGGINPLGSTGDTATIHTPGFIAHGMAAGMMRIAAPRGVVRLELVGPVQPGFAALPSMVSYTIVGGTGAYTGATGAGTIALTLNPSVASNNLGLITMTFGPPAKTT
jgi:hypothetical protein